MNSIKPLRKLNVVVCLISQCRIHHETHSFSKCFTVIEVVITINVENVGPEHSLHRLFCDARSLSSSSEKHIHAVVARYHNNPARQCDPKTPFIQKRDFFRGIIRRCHEMDDNAWIVPGWSLGLFPGQGVRSCINQPPLGIFCALATRAFILALNSSYSLWGRRGDGLTLLKTNTYPSKIFFSHTFIARCSFTKDGRVLSFK